MRSLTAGTHFRMVATDTGLARTVGDRRPVSLQSPHSVYLDDSNILTADVAGVEPPISSVLTTPEQKLRLFAELSLTRLRQYRH